MCTLSLAFSLVVAVSALHLRSQDECRVQMHNNEDIDYTVDLSIGGEVIQVIPDTGSFAMVLFSDACESCGQKSELLHPDEVKKLALGDHRAVQNYGSGSTLSVDAYAPARIACNAGKKSTAHTSSIRATKQMFWMTVKADMPVAGMSSFQGILGLGPPRSDVRLAQMEADEAKSEVDQLAAGGEDTSQYEPLVENLQDVAKLAKKTQMWLESEGVQTFSVCLPSELGSPGVLIYNDRKPVEKPALFASISVDNNGIYWQMPLSDVSLGSKQDSDRIRTSGSTTAILDTGTSLIGAPGWFVDSIFSFVSARIDELGCDDLSRWPALGFKLDGVALSLPPSSYLGKVMNPESLDEVPQVRMKMPHLSKAAECTALLFATDGDGQAGFLKQEPGDAPGWIFGLPFFRSYYTAFQLSKDVRHAHRVYVAEADEECNIKDPHAADAAKAWRVSEKFVAPLAIDPRKLRLPGRRGTSATPKQRQLLSYGNLVA